MQQQVRRFNADLERFIKRVPERAVDIQRLVALQLLQGFVMMTPVDTGRARGGWQLDIGRIPTELTETIDAGGGAVIGQAAGMLSRLQFGQIVAIVNNVHYVRYLEEGTSQQAPQGMVAVTLERVRQQFA